MISDARSKIILDTITRRAMELLPLGLGNFWMRDVGDERYHMATVLGIEKEVWDILKPLSSLYKSDGRMNTNTWEDKLKLTVITRASQFQGENGKHRNSVWYRFLGPAVVSSSRNTRGNYLLSETEVRFNDNLCARSEDAEENLLKFYQERESKGLLRAQQFAEPAILEIVRAKMEEDQRGPEEEEEEGVIEVECDGEVTEKSSKISEETKKEKEAFFKAFDDARPSWKRELFRRLVEENTTIVNGGHKVNVPTYGSRKVDLFKLPKMSENFGWDSFLKRLPIKFIEDILATTCGTIENGVKLFTRAMHNINQTAALEGGKNAGAMQISKLSGVNSHVFLRRREPKLEDSSRVRESAGTCDSRLALYYINKVYLSIRKK